MVIGPLISKKGLYLVLYPQIDIPSIIVLAQDVEKALKTILVFDVVH